MKKIALVLTALSITLFSSNVHAAPPQGFGSAAGVRQGSGCCGWSWLLAIAVVAVLAGMTGVVAGSSAKN